MTDVQKQPFIDKSNADKAELEKLKPKKLEKEKTALKNLGKIPEVKSVQQRPKKSGAQKKTVSVEDANSSDDQDS